MCLSMCLTFHVIVVQFFGMPKKKSIHNKCVCLLCKISKVYLIWAPKLDMAKLVPKWMETKFTRYIKLQYLNKIRALQILIKIIWLNIIAKNISVNDKGTVQVM